MAMMRRNIGWTPLPKYANEPETPNTRTNDPPEYAWKERESNRGVARSHWRAIDWYIIKVPC